MASNKETAKTVVDIDGKLAKTELEELEKKAKDLRTTLKAAVLANNSDEAKKLEKQLEAVKLKKSELKRASFDLQSVLNYYTHSYFNTF